MDDNYYFEEWLRWFDSKLQGRKVLLTLENCPAHTESENMPSLQNTEVFYLPSNTTSKLQPCDAGIIRSFKAYYFRSFHERLLQNVENGIVEPTKIDMLQAIKMCIGAWANTKASTFHNFFQHCTIRTYASNAQIITETMIEGPGLIQELNQHIRQLAFSDPMEINFPLNHPSENGTFIRPTDEEIVQKFDREEEAHLSSEEMDNSREPRKLSPSGALELLDLVELSHLQQYGNHRENLSRIRLLKEASTSANHPTLIRNTLDKYFS